MRLESLRSRFSKTTTVETESKIKVELRRPLSLKDLSGGKIPVRSNIHAYKDAYDYFAEEKCDILTIENPHSGKKERILIGPPLNALHTNFILYAAAADKLEGLNTADILADAESINNPITASNEQRTAAHKKILGWKEGVQSTEHMINFISANYGEYNAFEKMNPHDRIIPFLRWEEKDNTLAINLNPLEPEVAQAIQQALPDKVNDPNQLNTGLGLNFVSVYSPDLHVAKYVSYNPNQLTSRIQNMGPGQMMMYFFMKIMQERHYGNVPASMDIQKSCLLQGLNEYAALGKTSRYKKEKTNKKEYDSIRDLAMSYFNDLDLTKTSTYTAVDRQIDIEVDNQSSKYRLIKDDSLVAFVRSGMYQNKQYKVYEIYGKASKGRIKIELHDDAMSGSSLLYLTGDPLPKPQRSPLSKENKALIKEAFGIDL